MIYSTSKGAFFTNSEIGKGEFSTKSSYVCYGVRGFSTFFFRSGVFRLVRLLLSFSFDFLSFLSGNLSLLLLGPREGLAIAPLLPVPALFWLLTDPELALLVPDLDKSGLLL